MRKTSHWQDYELMDLGNGIKIERFNHIITNRPEPTALNNRLHPDLKANASYNKTWTLNKDLTPKTILKYRDMKFHIEIEQGKQVGIFPEQAVNWDWMRSVMSKSDKPLRILNLFAYTGGASIACAMENIEELVHIDALRSANNSAKENIILNNLDSKTIRIIQEDALKFLLREKRRGKTYHGIIMDPPSFGRGPNKEQWKIEDQLKPLIDAAVDILADDAVFLSINTYTSNLSSKEVLKIMNNSLQNKNFPLNTHSDSIGISNRANTLTLSSGLTSRWCHDAHLL